MLWVAKKKGPVLPFGTYKINVRNASVHIVGVVGGYRHVGDSLRVVQSVGRPLSRASVERGGRVDFE
jgi:hypothetical protein